MAVITRDEVKNILNLTDTTYDTQIETLIPYVQADVCDYLNTYFQDGWVYRQSGSAIEINRGSSTATAANPDTITDDDSYFLQKGFLSGMDVAIEGGYSNVGIHHVVTAAAGTLTLDSTGAVIDQDPLSANDINYIGDIRISRVNWPKALKPIVAQMIWYNIQRMKETDVKSESIDDYAVTYKDAKSGGYPESILRRLDKYRKATLR